MAEGTFQRAEIEIAHGELKAVLSGELYTRDYDLIVEIHPVDDAVNVISPERAGEREPSHNVKVRTRTGRMVNAGKAWTKRNEKGLMLSVAMTDPKLSYNVWEDNESGDWRVTGGPFS